MAGVYSRTAQCGMKVMFAAMRVLKVQGGSCRLSDLRSRLLECCDFSSWEKESVNGSVRWHNFLSWYSSCYVAAGFIRKQRGTWYLTEEGVACLSSSSESAAFDLATSAYKKCSGEASTSSPSGDILPTSSASFTLSEMKERADEGLRAVIASRSPYEFQDMVAALLHAMGYFTPFVAPKGKDGGVDVLAFHDPLGATIPRVKVQVKHMPSSSVSVDVVRQLVGLLNRDGDAGLVVTSGLFTSEAHRAARESHRSVRLIDGDEFLDLWIRYYSKMSEDDRSLLRITPVYFVNE
jgi:restriction system protein